MPEPAAQVTSSGQSIVERYAGLSGTRRKIVTDPARIMALIIGAPGSGKSRFFQDCPTGYYMNLERVSSSHPNPQSPSWPPAGENGMPAIVTYRDFETECKALQNLATAKRPRPTTVFIDSLPALESLLFSWIPEHAADYRLAKDNGCKWDDLHPQSAYRVLYDTVVGHLEALNLHGYGVYCCCHVSEKVIPLGDDKSVIKPELTMGNGLWARLKWRLEMVASITRSKRMVATTVERPVHGTSRTQSHQEFVATTAHTLTVNPQSDPLCEKILKCKPPLPDLVLPETGSWEAFVTSYNKAAGSMETP